LTAFLTDAVAGTLEQAISSHPLVAESCVVGIPDALKGHLPFAFVSLSSADHAACIGRVDKEIRLLVRKQVGAFASLGGSIIQGEGGLIPKTRSGKILRRVLRELLENGLRGEFAGEVAVPSTVDDVAVVGAARAKVKEYFEVNGQKHQAGG
jgi:propionyl-CoA synthetase